jgi:hypothetical protein
MEARGVENSPCFQGNRAMARKGEGQSDAAPTSWRIGADSSDFASDCPSPNRCVEALALIALRARNLLDFAAPLWGARDAGERAIAGRSSIDIRNGGCHP